MDAFPQRRHFVLPQAIPFAGLLADMHLQQRVVQLLAVDGLDDPVARPQQHGLPRRVEVLVAGNKKDVARPLLLPQRAEQANAVHYGHPDVSNQNFGVFRARDLQGLAPVPRVRNLDRLQRHARDHALQAFVLQMFVVRDQYPHAVTSHGNRRPLAAAVAVPDMTIKPQMGALHNSI